MATVATVRYDGSSCLNVRSITTACKILQSEPSAQPLTWDELWSVLWFVETAVFSKRLVFDGTVPGGTALQALNVVDALKRKYDLPNFDVHSIAFDTPAEILLVAGRAMAESRRLLDSFTIDTSVDKPLEEKEHTTFVQQLERAMATPEAGRRDLALEWVGDAFRGSKCLAALIADGDKTLRTAHDIYVRLGNDAVISAALINRFRLNYVNELAAEQQGAYVPDPAFEALTKQDVKLFQQFLLQQLIEEMAADRAADVNLLVQNLKSETPLPPIGLYALMATKRKGRPGAMLEMAYNEFRTDTSLMEMIWRTTKGGIPLKNPGELNEYFYSRFKSLAQAADGIKVVTSAAKPARTYLIPAVLKGLVKAVPEAVGQTAVGRVVYSVLREVGQEFTIPFLSERLIASGCDSYISRYQSLRWNLEHDRATQEPLARLASQVERVFGRKLAAA